MRATSGIYDGLSLPIIALPVGLAHKLDGNLLAAAMLAQMAFLTSISKGDDGWFDIPMQGDPSESASNLYDRCGSWRYMLGAGDRALREARKRLISLGLLSERLVGVPARLRYKVSLDRYLEFLEDKAVQPAKVGNPPEAAAGGANEEVKPVSEGGHAGETPGPPELGSADRDEDACSRSVDSQNQSSDDPSAAIAPVHDAPSRRDLNGASIHTNPEKLPLDVPNPPPPRAPREGGETASIAELIKMVADETGCPAEALEDAFRDRLRDTRSGAIANPKAWLRSIGGRLAKGEELSWGQTAAQDRRVREARARELDDQIRARAVEKSPQCLADPTHVARCLDAMPWAKPRIKRQESLAP